MPLSSNQKLPVAAPAPVQAIEAKVPETKDLEHYYSLKKLLSGIQNVNN